MEEKLDRKNKVFQMDDFMNSLKITNSNMLNPHPNKIHYLCVAQEDCDIVKAKVNAIKFYINKDRETREDGTFNRFGIDVIKLPPIGVRVFFIKEDKEEEIKVTYIPVIAVQYYKMKIVFDDPTVLIKCYTMYGKSRMKLVQELAQDNDIIFLGDNGFYSHAPVVHKRPSTPKRNVKYHDTTGDTDCKCLYCQNE